MCSEKFVKKINKCHSTKIVATNFKRLNGVHEHTVYSAFSVKKKLSINQDGSEEFFAVTVTDE